MSTKPWARVLRIVGIVLMGLTAVFTIIGGVGTSCVAISPTGFGGKFSGLASFQWLYILFVVFTFAFGVMGARAVFLLIRARANAYRYALIALIGGSVVGVIHIIVSRSLRGSSMPVDMVAYTSILTLVVFLVFRIPGLWQHIDYSKASPANMAGISGGLAAITGGAMALTIQYWMGPTHTINGVNYADVLHLQLQLAGWILVLVG
ncbi:MAG TPA: hypothetical protein VF831_08895, partial [Anaerolineales bacterium]